MKRFAVAIVVSATILGFGLDALDAASESPRSASHPTVKQAQLTRIVRDFYGPLANQGDAAFVGSEMCLACHSGPSAVHGFNAAEWRKTNHARPFKEVRDDRYSMQVGLGIIADANGNGIDDFKDGLDFNQEGITAFEAYKPFAPILGYRQETGYTMTIGEVTYRIFFCWGGNGMPAKQRFVVRIPVSDRPGGLSGGTYISPLQFNEATAEWVSYHPENWWNDDGTPVFTAQTDSVQAATRGRSFDRLCAGCHFTGTLVGPDSFGEWVSEAAPAILFDPRDPTYIDYNGDGIKEMTHIGCEACHGPGGLHIFMQDPELIIEPKKDLTTVQANESCGACHSRGESSNGTFGFPWDEANDHRYINGDDLNVYFNPRPGLWPDGKTSRQHHQQFQDFYRSSKPTFAFHEVKCYECHNAHLATDALIRDNIDDDSLRIPTATNDNSLCLACHATHGPFETISKEMVADLEANLAAIAQVVSAHTHHPYAPERRMGLSRCTGCHMPKVAKSAINYDISSHTFEALPPGKTLLYQPEGGMPNSCAVSCHRFIFDIFPNSADGDIGNWTEPSDIELATWAERYYGPQGIWWQTPQAENQEKGN